MVIPDWQSYIYGQAGPEGSVKCTTIGANCEPDIEDVHCLSYPEMHFVIFATWNFANFLNSLKTTLDACNSFVGGMTGDLAKNFFTPRSPPTDKIMPLAIGTGILSALTAISPMKFTGAPWFAGAAVAAGALTIFQGILTQDELKRPK